MDLRGAALLLLAFPLLAAGPAAAQAAREAAAAAPDPGPGIPLELAERRAAIIGELRCELRLRVPAERSEPLTGVMALHFALSDASAPLAIDFAPGAQGVRRLDANGSAAFRAVNGHLLVPAESLVAGANAVEIEFTAGDASLNRNADFLYTLFVPARAYLALPVFDQPSLKARWKLTLDLPAGWQALSNGAELAPAAPAQAASGGAAAPGAAAPGAAAPPEAGARREVAFAETEPLPTYLFSFVAGAFQVETAVRGGRTLRMFHRETDAAKLERNRDEIFDLHARSIAYMERYTAIPYAFGKFDFALIPALQFGGMEHAGAILYSAANLLLDESATQNQQLGRASVIAHETAHMWFGDLVTMRWFDDVWLKEVFANFMAAKIVNPSFPDVDHELRFLLSHYPAAYAVDRTAGSNPIRQPLDNLSDAGSLYGAIIYQKAPIAMRQLEARIGEESFRDGLREYLAAHAFGNATWDDLIEILDRRTPDDLRAWSRAWVEEAGRPRIRTELRAQGGAIARLAFAQEDPERRGRLWPQELRVLLGYEGHTASYRAQLVGREVELPAAAGAPLPRFVLAGGAGWAYGDLALDADSLRYLAAHPRAALALEPVDQGAVWVALWDAVQERELAAARFVDLALEALPLLVDEQLTQRVLGYLGGAWWRFLADGERAERAERVEATLRRGLSEAKGPSAKSAWFGALRAVATRAESVALLRRVWEQEEEVPGLKLAESDYIGLALDLAVRETAGWRAILETQLARIDNPDRRARFEFVMPALSSDPAERGRWFEALRDADNRRREPWVLEGLGYLHHPLRARASERYVQPSLELLREIQRTGDIFFPLRWLQVTLSGHRSPAVAARVRAFLAALPPDYPPRLRAVILQAADELFRATAAAAPAADEGPSAGR